VSARWPLLLLGLACSRPEAGPTSPVALVPVASIASELARRVARDQERRRTGADLTVVDRENTAWLQEVVRGSGWIRAETFGPQAEHDAWLLVQHADHDLAWQKEALALMEADRAPAPDLAYLRDRVLVNEGQPQLYGTQGRCGSDGHWEPRAIAQPRELEARRAAMHLEPWTSYAAFADEQLCRGKQER
jgi:hypothetical protein